MDRSALDEALLAAHAAGDLHGLILLYVRAAEMEGPGATFYLTHAYVFALEAADPQSAALRARLVAMGAERDESMRPAR